MKATIQLSAVSHTGKITVGDVTSDWSCSNAGNYNLPVRQLGISKAQAVSAIKMARVLRLQPIREAIATHGINSERHLAAIKSAPLVFILNCN